MKRGEEILKEACARIAMEETETLEKSISPKMARAAETLFQRQRRKIFALIARNAGKQKNRFSPYLRAAACLVLVMGAAWMLLHPKPQDPAPATQVPMETILPYYSASPSPSPSSVPTEIPNSPTPSPEITEKATEIPTKTPELTDKPTISPTETPKPTATPSPAPTETPAPVRKIRPENWSGNYFPDAIPEGYALLESREETGSRTAVYTDGEGGEIIFTEYDGAEMMPIPENARADYIPLHGGAALRLTQGDTASFVWQMEERTLVLTADADLLEEIAQSVKKISRE